MKRRTIVTFIAITALVCKALAWGPTGHRTTGLIAEQRLNKKAKSAIDKLLEGKSLAMASTWMDEVRSDANYDYMEDWHWVTIPQGMTYNQTTKNPKGDIIQTLERVISELKSKKLTDSEQAQRIKILIHLIGDIHQPLHVGSHDDKGGNEIKVFWFRNESNLHRVWDSEMIDDTKLSFTEFAQSLDKPSEGQLKQWQKISILEWASENQAYEKQIYNIGNGKLGYEYTYYNFHIIRHRLLQAGIRIAAVLNDIYGK